MFNSMKGRLATVIGLASLFAMVVAGSAFAAADSLTGIDPQAQVTSALDSGKLWIAAGVGVFVLGAAITLGLRYAGKFGVKK